MKKNSKILVVLLAFLMLSTTFIYADEPVHKKDDEHNYKTIRSQIFNNNESYGNMTNNSDMQALSPIYEPGTVRIDDVIEVSNGFVPDNHAEWGSYEIAKSVMWEILSFVPYTNKIQEILGWIGAVDSDFKAQLDRSAKLELTTRYNERPFYHDLYVFDDNYSWEYKGFSKSYYYYTQILADYIRKDTGDADTAKVNRVEPDCAPHTIKAADHYNDYSYLAFITEESWKNNRMWQEHPEDYMRTPSNYVKP
ncbi:MAG: hypothetical protein FH761_02235 [Firmicutes bacterium]|nr:hypothetical protein [Bacillota bacterium]